MPNGTTHNQAALGGLRIERVDTLDGLDRVRSEWQALEKRAANPLAYFQSFDWCRNWCAYHASGEPNSPLIRVYIGRVASRPVVIWPLMLTGSRYTIRRLVTLTEPHCQYSNILIDPRATTLSTDENPVDCCWRAIKQRESFDAFVLDQLPSSGTSQHSSEAYREMSALPAGQNSIMDLRPFAGCYESYRASLQATTRRARNKRRNRLAALGNLGYQVHCSGTPEYAELVSIGIDMKRFWLQQTGRATRALNLPHSAQFLASLSNNPEGDNGAVAAALTLDGRPIAVEIGFLYHQRFYSYLGAFDWELRRHSPGKVQLEEALRWCLSRGIEVYDLLGDPSTYKSGWSNVSESLTALQTARTISGQAYLSVWHNNLRPALKVGFERMPFRLRAQLIPMMEQRAARAVSGK